MHARHECNHLCVACILALLERKRAPNGLCCGIIPLGHKFFRIQLFSGLHQSFSLGEFGKDLQSVPCGSHSPLGIRSLRVTIHTRKHLVRILHLSHLHTAQAHQSVYQRVGLILGGKHSQLSHRAY